MKTIPNFQPFTWTLAGFLLGFGAPRIDRITYSAVDSLLAGFYVGIVAAIPAAIGGIVARYLVKRPRTEIRNLAMFAIWPIISLVSRVYDLGLGILSGVLFIALIASAKPVEPLES